TSPAMERQPPYSGPYSSSPCAGREAKFETARASPSSKAALMMNYGPGRIFQTMMQQRLQAPSLSSIQTSVEVPTFFPLPRADANLKRLPSAADWFWGRKVQVDEWRDHLAFNFGTKHT